MTYAEQATEFAAKNGLNIVSDMFGKHFVVQQEGQEAFKIAHVDTKTGRVLFMATTFASLDKAIKEIKRRTKIEASTEAVVSVPDATVIEAFCRKTGDKASDHVHQGYVTLSKPVEDRKRNWRVHKRVGTTLVPLEALHPDRWAAYAKVKALGGELPTTMLNGHFVFPFGNNFARPVPAARNVEERDGKAA